MTAEWWTVLFAGSPPCSLVICRRRQRKRKPNAKPSPSF